MPYVHLSAVKDLAVAQCITGNQGNEIKTRALRYEIFFFTLAKLLPAKSFLENF